MKAGMRGPIAQKRTGKNPSHGWNQREGAGECPVSTQRTHAGVFSFFPAGLTSGKKQRKTTNKVFHSQSSIFSNLSSKRAREFESIPHHLCGTAYQIQIPHLPSTEAVHRFVIAPSDTSLPDGPPARLSPPLFIHVRQRPLAQQDWMCGGQSLIKCLERVLREPRKFP